MRVKVEIEGVIDIPDVWVIPPDVELEDGNQQWTEDVVEFWFNEHLCAEDAIEDMASRLKKYPNEFWVRVTTKGVNTNEDDNRQS